jgi:RNA polymerase sigma factor (sigma-70 family)
MERSELEVERLVRDNQKLVGYQVSRYLKRYYVGHMEREDLISWGLMGLVQAARTWDPKRSRCFSTLACLAIERMIIRGVNREWKPKQAAATVSLDELMFHQEAAGHDNRVGDRIAGDPALERQLLDGETRMAVRSAVQKLPPLDRRLIERRFYEETPVAVLAQELGLTRQCIYQREKSALRRLRAVLSPSFAGQ